MTIEANSGKVGRFGRGSSSGRRETLPIGEIDANIFNCPACARPLGAGTPRCPGCGTRLMAGVRATRAVGFMAIGLVSGLAVAGGMMGVAAVLTGPSGIAVVDVPANVAPSAAPVDAPVASAPVPVVDPAIPSSAVSALRQSTVINQRLLADAERLTQALSASRPTAKEIAPILRGLGSTATFGDRLAPNIGQWDDGLAVSQGLAAFYAAIGGVAQDGLAASIANDRAYIDAGRRMLAILEALTDLDAASRALAAGADLELPPLIPAAP